MRRLIRKLFIKPLLAISYKYHFLKDNFIWRSIKPYYHVFVSQHDFTCVADDAVSFYSQNAERVNNVANMLADEKSRKIYRGLITLRQTRNNKDYPFHLIKEAQYFIKELKLGKDEVFIDCGAFIGDNIEPFLSRCKEYRQIIAFEPDFKNFEKLVKKYGNNSKITLINAAVNDKDGEVRFFADGSIFSKMVENEHSGTTSFIPAKSIDSLGLEKVSFMKMDIEGAELNALKGAEKTILRDKPKLAISIYHSDEDMIRIAEYIHNLIPEYKLYVRHYGFINDTILYGILPSD